MENDRILRRARDRAYFTRRAEEERSAADKATNGKARDAHQKMAESYEQRAHAAPADAA